MPLPNELLVFCLFLFTLLIFTLRSIYYVKDKYLHITCCNQETNWGTPCVSIHCVQADRVGGTWLQTLENQQAKQSEDEQKYKNHGLKILCIWSRYLRKVCCTWESVYVFVSWYGPGDGGVWVKSGRGGDEITSDRFYLGAPGECERSVLNVRDTHTSRRTYICIDGRKQS